MSFIQTQGQQLSSDAPMPADQFRTALDRYCVTCHNQTLKTAGLMLDQADIYDLSRAPQVWEKVITKLTLRTMPPAGMPRPDESFYKSITGYLKHGLNELAESNPNPGRSVVAHRLNRTEYTNAVRDLLDVEINGVAMLPPDNSSSFDNLGELLSVSELLMDKYIAAAREVSRLAIGDPTIEVDSVQYSVKPALLQDDRMSEDLPFGSRGGLAVRHRFPLDGEYVLNIRLQKSIEEAIIIGLAEPHRLDVRVDGKRIKLFTVGGENVGLSFAEEPDDTTDPLQSQYERTADNKLQVRFPMEAGVHTIQVAFLAEKSAWEGHIPPPTYDYFQVDLLGETYMRQWFKPTVSNITLNGPYDVKGAGRTGSRAKIFTCMPRNQAEEEPCARDILSHLARYAYRRPVTDTVISPLLELYRRGRDDSGSFEIGIGKALEGLLTSPRFLFRMERMPAGLAENGIYRISDLSLASRLSFFLWSSIPDEELLTLAEQGSLGQPEVLQQQVSRMLKDRRSASLVESFAEQWLLLRNLPQLHKSQEIFPEFDEELRQSLYTEVKLFVGSIFREDHPILDLLRADYTFLNERLARHYGVDNVYGSQFRKVPLADANQRGLLARAGILAITSYPTRNSTVLRGKWVLDNLLASPPPLPPDDIPPLEATQAPPGETLTLRERMEIHPANPTCAVCHNQMDPIGFGLENYNAIGQWRTEDEGESINAAGKLPSGVEFEGPAELQAALLRDPEVFTNAFTQKLLTYALGRPVEYFDMPAVREIVTSAAGNNYRFSSIVLGIANSTPFQMRKASP